MIRWSLLAGVLVLAACGPRSPEAVARECEREARKARGVYGMVGVGVSTSGPASRVDLGVSSDILRPRDPDRVYDDCVFRQTGAPPVRARRLR